MIFCGFIRKLRCHLDGFFDASWFEYDLIRFVECFRVDVMDVTFWSFIFNVK